MYSLRILGPADLTVAGGGSVRSVVSQPKRLALLAYLATAAHGRRTRTDVISVFWGHLDDDKARHALNQALYYLRRSIGKAALQSEGEVLALNADVVECDVTVFRELIAAEELEGALEHYGGDLLEGFAGAVAPDFDRWLDSARETFRNQATEAAERLSVAATARGDLAGAVEWAERAHGIAPYHEAPLRHLLSVLMADAQPLRARETLERFEARIREELGAEPSPATRALIERPPDPVVRDRDPGPVPVMDASREAEAGARVDMSSGPRRFAPPRWLIWAVAIGVAAIALLPRLGRDGLETESSQGRIGVFPFLYRGHQDLEYLGEGIAELLSITIRGLDRAATLDPRALLPSEEDRNQPAPSPTQSADRARELGAGHFVVGSVVEAGGQIQVTARLHAVDGRLVASVSERAEGENAIFGLVDDLARHLMASDAFPGPTDLERAAALTTGSLPALRHFLRGEGHFRAGRFVEATRSFDKAVAADSAFALAMYRGAVASIWSDEADFESARRRVDLATGHADEVSPLEADLFAALEAFLEGRLGEAERLYLTVLSRQPENVEAWFQLGEVRFHYGALHGRNASESASAWTHLLSLTPDHRPGLIHMAAVAALQRDSVAVDSIEALVNPAADRAPVTPQTRALRVFLSGDDLARAAFLEEVGRYPAGTVASTAAYAARFLRDPEAGRRIAETLLDSTRPASDRAQGHLFAAYFDLALGRPARAQRELAEAAALAPEETEIHQALLSTLPAVPLSLRGGRGEVVDMMPRLDLPRVIPVLDGSNSARMPMLHAYSRALAYHAAGGEDGAILSVSRRLEASSEQLPSGSLSHGLAAERHLRMGDTLAARTELDAALVGVGRWYEHLRDSHLWSLARERFLLAEIEWHFENAERAEGLLGSIGDNALSELPYLFPALVRTAEIRESEGDLVAAHRAYERALNLWSDSEEALAPVVDELRRRHASLESRLASPETDASPD